MHIQGVEVALRFGRDLRSSQSSCVLRDHQRSTIQRGLHRGAGVVDAGIVYSSTDEPDDRHDGDGEDDRDVACIGMAEFTRER